MWLNFERTLRRITVKLDKRIKCILPSLIHPDQAGFMKGRCIGQNTRLLKNLWHYPANWATKDTWDTSTSRFSKSIPYLRMVIVLFKIPSTCSILVMAYTCNYFHSLTHLRVKQDMATQDGKNLHASYTVKEWSPDWGIQVLNYSNHTKLIQIILHN